MISKRYYGDIGFIEMTSDGRVRLLSTTARRLLKKFFDDTAIEEKRSLPVCVKQWFQQAQSSADRHCVPLILEKKSLRLRIHYIENMDDEIALMLWEERSALAGLLASLAIFGLTSREIEIMGWLQFGKSNVEISGLMEVSLRTVHKNLESIFSKLGVENPMAATAILYGIGMMPCYREESMDRELVKL